MAQHDYSIANQSGSAFRSDLNNALSAIVTQNSGTSSPSSTFAHQMWADTTNNVMKLRNAANDGWIELYQLDGEWTDIAFENGTAAAPSIYFKDSGTDTGFYSPGANQVGISTGGTSALVVDASQRVGIGTSSPGSELEVKGSTSSSITVRASTGAGNLSNILFKRDGSSGDTRIRSDVGNNTLEFITNGSQQVTINNSGNVGIGTTSPAEAFTLGSGNAQITSGQLTVGVTSSSGLQFINDGTFGTLDSNPLVLRTASAERARIDTSGRLLVGTSTARSTYYGAGISAGINVEAAGNLASSNRSISVVNGHSSSTDGDPILYLGRTRSDSIGGTTSVQSGDQVGRVAFMGSDGTSMLAAAQIQGVIDGTPGTNDMPGRLVFSTTADGGSSPTERMRIASDGRVTVKGGGTGTTIALSVTNSADTALFNVRNDGLIGTGTTTNSPYNFTTASAANMFVDSGGLVYRSTSSLKYKKNIADAQFGLQELLALRPVTYQSKTEADGETLYGGLIAEEVDAAGLQEFVQYADDGTPDALAYGNMVALCIKAIQEQQAVITELQAKVAALESA